MRIICFYPVCFIIPEKASRGEDCYIVVVISAAVWAVDLKSGFQALTQRSGHMLEMNCFTAELTSTSPACMLVSSYSNPPPLSRDLYSVINHFE